MFPIPLFHYALRPDKNCDPAEEKYNRHRVQSVALSSTITFVSSVGSSYSHPDLLLTQHQHHPLFKITPVLNTGLSLSEPLQLYKGYNAKKAITGLDVLASWMPHGFNWASLMMTWGDLGHYLGTTWG